MNIVFFTKDKGRVGSLNLNPLMMAAAAVFVLLVLPLTMLFTGLHFGSDASQLSPDEQVAQFQQSLDAQEHYIDVSWLYGQWLRQQALHHGMPVVIPRPRETLEERIVNAGRSEQEE